MIIFSDLHAHNFLKYSINHVDYILESLETILQEAVKTNEAVLFCGDIVEKQGYVPVNVVNGLLDIFLKYPTVQIYAISGNHDQAFRNTLNSPSQSVIDILVKSCPNIHSLDYQMLEIEGYKIVGIPYLDSSDDFVTALSQLSTIGADILLAHQKPSTIMSDIIKTDIDITNPLFNTFKFVFFGHIHKFFDFGNNKYMVGNPVPLDSSDRNDAKGYLTLRNGKVERVILDTPIKAIIDNQFKEYQSSTTVRTVIDQRMYSDSLLDQLEAFCEKENLKEDIVKVGKELIL